MTRTTTAVRFATAGLFGVLGVFGALALTACDSGSGAGTGTGASASTGDSASADPSASASTTGGAGAAAGSWLATSGGKAVVLMLNGEQAALFSTDRTTCTGSTRTRDGKQVIRLGDCKARTAGTVTSVNKTTLQVTWEGGLGKETYTRAAGGALPSGLPTASPSS
ncbi:hypothetical protein ABZ858_30675 [Streptomyces sp. NPDC047017]|uniref:hypothetical protein n=1 Tax=Streptomyces sp. NPDC047017 TaxID=3155024 RepID=UPI0033F9EA00